MAEANPRQGILSLAIKEKKTLYMAYMPFVMNGGLFIPTKRDYELGQEVFMLLTLMDEKERLPIAGKIIWKTPEGSDNYKATGIGIQFSDQDDGLAKKKIEEYLAGVLESERANHTM